MPKQRVYHHFCFASVVLSKNLGVKPVEKSQDVNNKQNPGNDRECFIKAFEERGAILFSPVYAGKDIDKG